VKPEEVEAVLGGARLVEKREPVAEAIRRAAIVEDALAHYSTARVGGDNRLTPELAMAYSMRERGKLLDLHKDASKVPPAVKVLFDWTNQDPLVSRCGAILGCRTSDRSRSRLRGWIRVDDGRRLSYSTAEKRFIRRDALKVACACRGTVEFRRCRKHAALARQRTRACCCF